MKTRSMRSSGWAIVLVILGLLAFYAGPRGLAVLIPAAILVWYAGLRPVTWDNRHIDLRVDNRAVGR